MGFLKTIIALQVLFCVAAVMETKEKKEKDRCVTSCKKMADGDYQSCKGCDVYVSCVGGKKYDNRPCAANLMWDDYKKICASTSTTCKTVEHKPKLEAEKKPQLKAELKPKLEAVKKPQLKAELKLKLEAVKKPQLKAELKPKLVAVKKPQLLAKLRLEAEKKPQPIR